MDFSAFFIICDFSNKSICFRQITTMEWNFFHFQTILSKQNIIIEFAKKEHIRSIWEQGVSEEYVGRKKSIIHPKGIWLVALAYSKEIMPFLMNEIRDKKPIDKTKRFSSETYDMPIWRASVVSLEHKYHHWYHLLLFWTDKIPIENLS